MSQEQIKEDKEYVSTFFTRLSEIQKLGGYLIVAVEPVKPDNLPSFIANYNNLNVNGTNEKTKDRNMFMLAGWAGLFDYFNDINVEKNFTFRKTKNKDVKHHEFPQRRWTVRVPRGLRPCGRSSRRRSSRPQSRRTSARRQSSASSAPQSRRPEATHT